MNTRPSDHGAIRPPDHLLLTSDFFADPYPIYHRLRAEAPVYWSDTLGAWVLTRHADVMAALRVEILACALVAPFRRIAQNTGVAKPSAVLDEARRRGANCGYDALRDCIVDMNDAGIVDAAGVLCLALETAVSGAVIALTTDTIVLHAKPQIGYEP